MGEAVWPGFQDTEASQNPQVICIDMLKNCCPRVGLKVSDVVVTCFARGFMKKKDSGCSDEAMFQTVLQRTRSIWSELFSCEVQGGDLFFYVRS